LRIDKTAAGYLVAQDFRLDGVDGAMLIVSCYHLAVDCNQVIIETS